MTFLYSIRNFFSIIYRYTKTRAILFFLASCLGGYFVGFFSYYFFGIIVSILLFEISTNLYISGRIYPIIWMVDHVPDESKEVVKYGFGLVFYLFYIAISFYLYIGSIFIGSDIAM